MLQFAFWNLNRRPLEGLVRALVHERDVDVLVLTECSVPLPVLLTTINDTAERTFYVAPGQNQRLVILTRLPADSIIPVADLGGLALRHVVPPVGSSILLAAVHLRSKLHLSDDDQAHEAMFVAREVEAAEAQLGHTRTLVLGDLNMNPFEAGVVGSSAFHAISARAVATRVSRTVNQVSRPFFYNPSWRLLASSGGQPPGTYYYSHSGAVSYFWNTFDQVLVRPVLLSGFGDDDLKLVTALAGTSLLTAAGIPDTAVASDHLPITVSIDHGRLEEAA